ncbi:MAG: hypothetical protein VB076_11445, partial [Synergistaceae bacterium]|nr:hypothetical protein [Synergistaceae bacterium]
YQDAPTQLMLTEILMKNYLKIIYKRRIEHQQWTEMYKMFPELKDDCDYHLRGINLDLNEYYKEYQSAKAAYNKKTEKANRLIFYKKLPYNIPIAFQLGLALLYDMEGNIINDIYNTTPHSHLKQIHICAFPLVEYSVVFMFVDTKTKRYNNFCRQFLNFSFDVQLSIINYIIFLYSEDFYMHPLISHDLSKNKNFNKVIGQLTTAVPSYLGCPTKVKPILAGKDAFDLNKWNSIPNLFSECYKTNF